MSRAIVPLLIRTTARLDQFSLMVEEKEAPGTPVETEELPEGSEATWSGIIGVEGELTGDGRLIELNALRWDTLPIPLRWVVSDSGGHDNAVVVGRITDIERSGGDILASGDFDLGSEAGREAARQVKEGLQTGISMDLDEVAYEVRLKGEVYEEVVARQEAMLNDEDISLEFERDEEGRVILDSGSVDDEVVVTTAARIRAATGVAIPAFERTRIALSGEADEADVDDDLLPEDDEQDFNWVEDVGGLPKYIKRIEKHLIKKGMTESRAIATAVNAAKKMCATGDLNLPGSQQVNPGSRAEACAAVAEWEEKKAEANASRADTDELRSDAFTLVAGAAPLAPPREWFNDPGLSEPTPVKITADGRMYGHIAVWGTCHTAYPGECVAPPSSPSGYSRFHLGALLTAEGEEIAVGRITMDTLHATPSMSPAATLAHYENTGRVAADVVAGEDAYGIWVAGALRPNISAEKVRSLRSSPLSGDWRRVGRDLELHAVLAVNVPGFPVPRTHGLVASGATQALIASGMLAPEKVRPPGSEDALSTEDLRYLQRLARRERERQQSLDGEAAQLARQVEARALARKVRGSRLPFDFAGRPWEKQRRVPAGRGRLSGRWADMFGMPLAQGDLIDMRGGSAEPHLIPHPSVPDQRIFSPERVKAVHRPYIDASMKGITASKDRPPRYTMMGGGPASGKSSVIRARRGTDTDLEEGRVIINPDLAKTGGADEGRPDIPGIPEYAERVNSDDPALQRSAAGFVHEESSYMAKMLTQAAIDGGFDITNDGTGDSGYQKLAAKVAQARAEGYEVEGQYVTVPTEEALVRAKIRGYEQGRQVSSTMLIGTHTQVSAIAPEVLEDRLFDSFELWDTAGPGGEPRLVVRYDGPDSELEIGDEALYAEFLAKGEDTVEDALTRAADLARERLESGEVPDFIQKRGPEAAERYLANLERAATELQAELDDLIRSQEAMVG